nr:IQ domain containing protein K [Hymenolepis microstoma]
MESVNFLPVEILLKICKDCSDSTGVQATVVSQEKKAIAANEDTHYFNSYLLPELKIAMCSLITEVIAKDVLYKFRNALNPLEHLALKLYVNNSRKGINGRHSVQQLEDVPWAAKFFAANPRRILPLHYYLTRSESAIIIQKYWRGYMVRKRRDIQELRNWQREWRIQLQSSNPISDPIQSISNANAANSQ